MEFIRSWVSSLSVRARHRRAVEFRRRFELNEGTRILDLGSGSGANIHSVLQGTPVRPENVYIADIDPALVARGSKQFGYVPVLIGESERLQFEDGFFDIVFCSSVIEHATVPKQEVWSLRSGSEFKERSLAHQRIFAHEIERLGRRYFVQTPYRHFPVESHTWLPFVAWLPRRSLIPVLRISNRFWVKKTSPDWYLLNRSELKSLFSDAVIVSESYLGMTKSIMAIGGRGGGRPS